MQISKWGNSLAVRLPAAVVKALKLREGDTIDIVATGRGSLGIAPRLSAAEQLRRLRTLRGRLPADFKFDRERANAR